MQILPCKDGGAEYRLASLFRQVSGQPALPKVRIVFTESPGLSVQFFGPRPRETLVKMIKVSENVRKMSRYGPKGQHHPSVHKSRVPF